MTGPRRGHTWWHAVVVVVASLVLAATLIVVAVPEPPNAWSPQQWVRAAEVVWMAVVAVVYLWSLWEIVWHLRFEPRRRRVTAFERRLHTARAIRQASILCFVAGAAHSAVTNFDAPLSFRAFAWVFGCLFAFVAWSALDRRRWEVGLT
jgi:hypothetical protein